MRWTTASFAVLLALGTSASAEPIEDFYKGKSINWILSAGAGGGYSSYAHVFAPYLSAHIPGKPNIVVQNMPGAGGIRAMIFLSNVAPKDGTTIGMVHSSVPYAPLYGIRGANFDPRRMSWIGSINAATGICVSWTASGITTWSAEIGLEPGTSRITIYAVDNTANRSRPVRKLIRYVPQ